jgi:glycolate oxidase iron-sulfur subunit
MSPTTPISQRTSGFLKLEEDLLVSCVSCGLCLPHCPTYRATGEELLSPRGRIAVMRAVETENLTIDDTIRSALDTCVMCRGCETACPSGVQFGRLMEDTRSAIAKTTPPPLWLRMGLRLLSAHRLVLGGSTLLGVGQRLRIVPPSLSRRFGAPDRVAIRRPALTQLVSAQTADAYLFTGCVMDAWQRDVHADALALMQATGAQVAVPTSHSCCGALHSHSGLTSDARKLAQAVIDSCPGNAPVVVDSAGCGAALQDYGHLLNTDEAKVFSTRVVDISTWLAERIDKLGPAAASTTKRETVVVQDPCHLRHVQRTHGAVRTLLNKYVDIIELPDDGRCCGAGGAYSIQQPELATSIRNTKVSVIDAALNRDRQTVVASGNPGCSMWLAQAGLRTEHPVTVVARHARTAGWIHART